MSEVIVYQVRSVDALGKQNVVHAYETEQDAQNAINMMKRPGKRYIYVAVPNNPNEHWGINFPVAPAPAPKVSRRRS